MGDEGFCAEGGMMGGMEGDMMGGDMGGYGGVDMGYGQVFDGTQPQEFGAGDLQTGGGLGEQIFEPAADFELEEGDLEWDGSKALKAQMKAMKAAQKNAQKQYQQQKKATPVVNPQPTKYNKNCSSPARKMTQAPRPQVARSRGCFQARQQPRMQQCGGWQQRPMGPQFGMMPQPMMQQPMMGPYCMGGQMDMTPYMGLPNMDGSFY